VKDEKYWNKIPVIANFALYILQFALSLAFFQRAKLLRSSSKKAASVSVSVSETAIGLSAIIAQLPAKIFMGPKDHKNYDSFIFVQIRFLQKLLIRHSRAGGNPECF